MQPASTATSELATAQPASLCAWMPSGAVEHQAELADDLHDLVRQRAAVGVAQDDRVGASPLGRRDDLERVRRIGLVAVEEVLGVEEDGAVLRLEVGDRVVDHPQVLFERGAAASR